MSLLFKRIGSQLKPNQLDVICNNFKSPSGFFYSTQQPPSLREKFKTAAKQYGSILVVFHVSISLVSLGTCYVLVSSGLNVEKAMITIGVSGEKATKYATSAGTFAASYAIHKVFAPVRMVTTLTAVPFLVKHLRKIGYLKK